MPVPRRELINHHHWRCEFRAASTKELKVAYRRITQHDSDHGPLNSRLYPCQGTLSSTQTQYSAQFDAVFSILSPSQLTTSAARWHPVRLTAHCNDHSASRAAWKRTRTEFGNAINELEVFQSKMELITDRRRVKRATSCSKTSCVTYLFSGLGLRVSISQSVQNPPRALLEMATCCPLVSVAVESHQLINFTV